ncbi:MAG: hypothetical protein P1U69_09075 [Parvibaculaceae bacterium]|nr:hypothetical protein [Parvibaculaceae bacterium]HBM88757.1 hypothetical protein [Rhodobiaceae bacterium]
MVRLKLIRRVAPIATVVAFALSLSVPAANAVDNSHNPALPQFEVGNSGLMLHNSVRAENLTQAVQDADAALATCDKSKWMAAMGRLDSASILAERAISGPAGKIVVDADEEDEDAIDAYSAKRRAEWKAKCAKRETTNSGTSFTAGGSLSVGQLSLPQQQFLAFEAIGTLIQSFGIVNIEEEARATAGSFDGSAHFADADIFGSNGLWTAIGYVRTTANASASVVNIDPNGDRLLIPGPLGGASGFSLASAGGLNVVTQADYEAHYEWDSFYAKIGLPFVCEEWLFMPFFGAAYTDQEQTSSFSGNIPGFGRNFAYNTQVDVETISPFIGFDAVRHFNGVSVHGGGLLSADFNDADGWDRLSFTGVANSQASLSGDDTSLGGRAWAGITFGAPQSPFKLSLDASYVYVDNIPVITRDGTNPSSLGFESADGVLGTIRATFRF